MTSREHYLSVRYESSESKSKPEANSESTLPLENPLNDAANRDENSHRSLKPRILPWQNSLKQVSPSILDSALSTNMVDATISWPNRTPKNLHQANVTSASHSRSPETRTQSSIYRTDSNFEPGDNKDLINGSSTVNEALAYSCYNMLTTSYKSRPHHRADDSASSISGFTASDTSRSKTRCHVCKQPLASGSGSVIQCASCPRRYHGYCLPGPRPYQKAVTSWQCKSCIRKAVPLKGISSDTVKRSHEMGDQKAVEDHVAKRQTRYGVSQYSKTVDPRVAISPHSTRQTLLQRAYPNETELEDEKTVSISRNDDTKASRLLASGRADLSTRISSPRSVESFGMSLSGTDETVALVDQSIGRPIISETLDKKSANEDRVSADGINPKSRTVKRPSKTEKVLCSLCKKRLVPRIPSGMQAFCAQCKDNTGKARVKNGIGSSVELSSSSLTPEGSLRPLRRTGMDRPQSKPNTSDPKDIASKQIRIEQDIAAGRLAHSAGNFNADGTLHSTSPAAQRQNASPTDDSFEGSTVHKSNRSSPETKTIRATSTDTSAMDIDDDDYRGCQPTILRGSKAPHTNVTNLNIDIRSTPDSTAVMAFWKDSFNHKAASKSRCKRSATPEPTSFQDEVRNHLASSLFEEWPEYIPMNNLSPAAKAARIARRPRRKELFGKSTLYSQLGEVKIFEPQGQSRGSVTRPSPDRHISDMARSIDTGEKRSEKEGIITEYFDSIDGFLGVSSDLVPTLQEGKLCYRDQRRNANGTLSRATFVCPTGI